MSRTATLSAAATVTEVNKDQLITNNSTVDIVVIDAGGKDTGGVDPVPMLTIYEQDLAILPTKDNQKFIKAGAADTVTLNDTYTDADDPTPTYSTSYELIIASAACLYPVKSTGAKYILKSKTYAPIVVAADDETNMKSAENFQQTLMAYPSSTMAKDFANALNDAGDTGTSADGIDAKVNAFFAGSKGFQKVTLNMITAFTTYYNQYPYVWAGYQGSKTYYLYTSDGNAVNSMGSVQIKVPTAIPADTDKSLKGYTLTYTDATGASSSLYYVKGQFEDQRSNFEDHLETASETAQTMLDYGNPPSLRKLNGEIASNYEKIDGASTSELPGVLPEVQKGVIDINTNMKFEITRDKASADAATQKELNEAQEAMEQAEKTAENIDDDKNDAENGDTPEDMDFQPHEFQPGIFD